MASALQNISATTVDGVVVHARRSLTSRSNASVLVLLESSFEASLGLFDVDLSTRAWYLVYDIRLFLDRERVFDFTRTTRASGRNVGS